MTDLTKLAELAEKATPGPWHVETCTYDESRVDGIYGPERYEDHGMGPEKADTQIVETDGGYYPPKMPDAAFIAAASPDVVSALIARVRELEEGLKEALDQWDIERDTEGYYQHERSIALRSLLARGNK